MPPEAGGPVRHGQERGLRGLDAAIDFIQRHAGSRGGLVQGLLAPDRVETCTLSLLQRTIAAADELDVPIRLHMAQGLMEREAVQSLHGSTAPRGWAGTAC